MDHGFVIVEIAETGGGDRPQSDFGIAICAWGNAGTLALPHSPWFLKGKRG